MTPAESAAAAAWAAAVVAFLFGGTGFVVGLIGLHHARQAKEAAAASNLIAKDANALSKSANSISEESNGIAREANEISRQTADRGNELHDVGWEWKYARPPREGMVTIQNIGKDPAKEVTIQFFFEDAVEANKLPIEVNGRATVDFEIPGLVQSIMEERGRVSAREARGPMASIVPYFPAKVRTRLRVKWRTSTGAPKQYDSDWISEYLPD